MGWNTFDNNGARLDRTYTDNPIGEITGFAGSIIPVGWLACDGSAVSRTTYAELFSVIGTTYGTGNGSTTFNLPTSDGDIIYAQSIASRIGPDGTPSAAGGDLTGIYPNPTIAANAITAEKVASGAVTTEKVASGAITSSKLGASSVSLSFLSAASTTARQGAFGTWLIYEEATLTITAGTWLVSAGLTLTNTSTTDDAYCAVYNRTSSAEVSNTMGLVGKATTTTDYQAFYSRPQAVTFSATTDICPVGNRNGASTLRAARGAGVGQVGWINALKLTN